MGICIGYAKLSLGEDCTETIGCAEFQTVLECGNSVPLSVGVKKKAMPSHRTPNAPKDGENQQWQRTRNIGG
jgi:hypothetical protein